VLLSMILIAPNPLRGREGSIAIQLVHELIAGAPALSAD
jgi:hypothetical protein